MQINVSSKIQLLVFIVKLRFNQKISFNVIFTPYYICIAFITGVSLHNISQTNFSTCRLASYAYKYID